MRKYVLCIFWALLCRAGSLAAGEQQHRQGNGYRSAPGGHSKGDGHVDEHRDERRAQHTDE